MFKCNYATMRTTLFICLLLLARICPVWAQAPGERSYSFLDLPVSAHAAALGGDNISKIEDDLTLAIHNPALLSSVSNHTLSLGYMNYMEGINSFHAAYSQFAGERGTWGASIQYLDYGTFSRRDEQDQDLGTFRAKDFNIMGMYAYNLTDYWSGGVAAKVVYCSYESYSSIALAADLALNYYNAEWDFSFSAVARNLGGEVKSFEDETEKLPVNLMIGATKRFSHAPIALHLTLSRLQDWDESFAKHVSLGADIYPIRNFYVAGGYSFRKADEMKVGESSHGAGWSFGAGCHIKKVKIDAAYGKYHVAGGSLLMNIAYAF